MSLLLAPYNEGMRLGMGFNSYTQSTCINNAVQKSDGPQVTENDLKSVSTPITPVPDNESTDIKGADSILSSTSGTKFIKTTDGQSTVSQTVTWEAKFVDKISEVTDSMNISGSLAICVDAIGGGGKAEGHFLDSTKFKDSDINYYIHVTVTNQKLIAEDVTHFAPIRNVQPSQFTEVYGDSYISGFLEGGEFNALVSVKLKDRSNIRDFGGSLAVDIGFTGVSVEGEAKGGKKTGDTSSDSEMTISVSWSGGGDIKPNDITDWDVKSLKQVAMEFPDLVARCPQRTSAILTKYTGLRSFYEQTQRGSPLDYENAGVYASSLLDAYMDYKYIWKSLQTAIWEVDNGLSKLEGQETNDDLKHLGEIIQEDFAKRSAQAKIQNAGNETALVGVKKSETRVETQLLEPNKLIPYRPSVYGLDQARRDCRFEMIKIVREVAIDPSRSWQYLSPVVFRKLIPKVTNIKVEDMELDAGRAQAQMKIALEAQNQEKAAKVVAEKKLQAMEKELKTTKETLKTAQEDIDARSKSLTDADTAAKTLEEKLAAANKGKKDAETAKGTAESNEKNSKAELEALKASQNRKDIALSGVVKPLENGWHPGANSRYQFNVGFPTALVGSPRVLYGLSGLDCHSSTGLGLSCSISEATQTGFRVSSSSFGDCHTYSKSMSWLQLPNDGIHLEHGVSDTYNVQSPSEIRQTVEFSKAFTQPPKVLVWLYEMNKRQAEVMALRAYAIDTDAHGFTLIIGSSDGTQIAGARAMWFAYDADEDGKRVRSGMVTATKDERQKKIKESSKFDKPPATFTAISEVYFNHGYNYRASTNIKGAADLQEIECSTWGDSAIHHVHATWIAIS